MVPNTDYKYNKIWDRRLTINEYLNGFWANLNKTLVKFIIMVSGEVVEQILLKAIGSWPFIWVWVIVNIVWWPRIPNQNQNQTPIPQSGVTVFVNISAHAYSN